MKEDEIKNNLIISSKWIDSKEAIHVKNYLLTKFDYIQNVFVLHHHYGQADEQYVFMINGETIVDLETVENEVTEYESSSIKAYFNENRKIPKLFRATINIAEALSKEK